jgi:hypothetical protein
MCCLLGAEMAPVRGPHIKVRAMFNTAIFLGERGCENRLRVGGNGDAVEMANCASAEDAISRGHQIGRARRNALFVEALREGINSGTSRVDAAKTHWPP